MNRTQTRRIQVGRLAVGGGQPISVQSMTNTDTRDIKATVEQIACLEAAGCELVRLAVVDQEAAKALGTIRKHTDLPLAADIHFDHRLALDAIAAGVDKLRINPGNIGSDAKVRAVVGAAQERGIAIRIGVNAGSLSKQDLERYGLTAKAMVESALRHVAILERAGFYDTIISLKATDIALTLDAYRSMAERTAYPLHVGITEAGSRWFGTIKSAAGLGAILLEGIGDTLRVSLTGDPVEEVRVGYAILAALDLRRTGPVFVSCPTCGRTELALEEISSEVERRLHDFPLPVTIAVMGCPVNGPGEAKAADLGIAGGKGIGLVFRKGEVVRKVNPDELVEALIQEAQTLLEEMSSDSER